MRGGIGLQSVRRLTFVKANGTPFAHIICSSPGGVETIANLLPVSFGWRAFSRSRSRETFPYLLNPL
jgi:hypothetical protein